MVTLSAILDPNCEQYKPLELSAVLHGANDPFRAAE
jgi:hypothetical protein